MSDEFHILILNEWAVHIGSFIFHEVSQVGQFRLIWISLIFQLFHALESADFLIFDYLNSLVVLWASAPQFFSL